MNEASGTATDKRENPPAAAAEPAKDTEARTLRFLGFKLTDITSVTAFVLSLTALAYQGWIKYQGAQVQFLPPEEIAFRCEPVIEQDVEGSTRKVERCAADSYVTVTGSALTYMNRGHPEYGGVVVRESLTATIGGRNIDLDWKYHTNITTTSASQKIAIPFTVPGGQALGIETRFSPRYRQCADKPCEARSNFLLYKDFAKIVADNPESFATFQFTSTIGLTDPKKHTATCRAQYTAKMAEALQSDWTKYRRTTLTCER